MSTSRRASSGPERRPRHTCEFRAVKGYTAANHDPVTPMKVGIMKAELDTPALCVDLDKLERNIAKMQRTANANKIGVRPHAKTHKCAAIAKLQMAAGALGICVAKLSEAEALMPEGLDRVLMTTSNLPPAKIRRAMQLKKRFPGFVQAVDYDQNARDLNDAAKEAGVIADVVIDVAVGTRSGIPPGEDAIKLAQLVDQQPASSCAACVVRCGVPARRPASPRARNALSPPSKRIRGRSRR